MLRKAYKDAGIDPRTVDYIEAHGTGTILGDPIEADALGRVVGRGRPADRPALLGAVKSNVGHLESAAGAASLAKMVLALQHDKLPPSINYAGPNPYIDFDAVHLKVADTVTDWPRYSGHAIAGVSGFGFGGANAHLVLREVLPTRSRRAANRNRSRPKDKQADAAAPTRCTSAACGWTSTASSSTTMTTTTSPATPRAADETSPNCPASPTRPCGCIEIALRRARAAEGDRRLLLCRWRFRRS